MDNENKKSFIFSMKLFKRLTSLDWLPLVISIIAFVLSIIAYLD